MKTTPIAEIRKPRTSEALKGREDAVPVSGHGHQAPAVSMVTHGRSGPQGGSAFDASRLTKSLLKTSGLRFSNWFLNLAWFASHQALLKHMLPN